MTKMVSIRMPQDMIDWLKKKADADHRSLTGQILHTIDKQRAEDNKQK